MRLIGIRREYDLVDEEPKRYMGDVILDFLKENPGYQTLHDICKRLTTEGFGHCRVLTCLRRLEHRGDVLIGSRMLINYNIGVEVERPVYMYHQ